MTISVLIPTAGLRPAWLEEARASAARQTGVAVEVVVEHDYNGRGQSATLNRAFARSTGAWVTVCHDDDFYVRDDALALMLAQGLAHPEAAAVFTLPQYVLADGTVGPTPTRLTAWMERHPRVRWEDLADGLHVHGTGLLYRREWWAMLGGWDESLPCCEEYEWHLRLLSHGAVFVGLPSVVMAYRHHHGQKSGRRAGTYGRTSSRRLAVQRQLRAQYGGLAAAKYSPPRQALLAQEG